jgi:predicted thioesterase
MAFETRQELELRWGQLDANEFAVVKIQNISRTPPHILGVGDVVEIWVNVKEIEEPHALKAQRIATLILTPKIGFETHVRAIVPEILWTKKVVSLYW